MQRPMAATRGHQTPGGLKGGCWRPSRGRRAEAGGRGRQPGKNPSATWRQTAEVNLPGPRGSRAVALVAVSPEVPAASITLPALGFPDPTLVALGTALPDLAASGVVLGGLCVGASVSPSAQWEAGGGAVAGLSAEHGWGGAATHRDDHCSHQ